MPYFYLLTGKPEERELASLELWALSGVHGDGVCGESPVAADLTGAAYVRLCAETLAAGESLPELGAALRARRLVLDRFRLEVYRPLPRAEETLPEIVQAVADAWEGRPDLEHPRVRLAVLAQAGRWRVGRIVSESHGDWRLTAPPGDYSAALPAQFARALVNLVAAPGDTLLDPCCGIGTVVVQAARRGVRGVGVEVSKKLAGSAADYVRRSGVKALICAGDARTWAGHYDAAVVDFPYGRASHLPPDLYRDVLTNLRHLVPRAAIVSAAPLDTVLRETGFRVRAAARVRSGSLTRHVQVVA